MTLYYPHVNAVGVSTAGNSGGNTGTSNGSFVFVGSNNITISQSTGTNNVHSLYFSGPAAGGATGSISAGTTRGTLGEVVLSNSNGVTFGINGQTVTASHNGLTSQSNQALSAANGSFAFQTATFANSNGISFLTGTQGLYASHNALTSQTNQQLSLYAVSNTTQSSSGTANASNLSFHGAGVASVGVSNGSVMISVPAGGGAGDGVNIIAAGSQTANTTGTVSFADSNGVTFGMSNSSVVTASYGRTDYSRVLGIEAPNQWTVVSVGQNTCYFTPFQLENNLSIRYMAIPMAVTVSSSAVSSGQVGRTFQLGLYSRNATNDTVLTQFYSTTHTIAGSYSSNASMAMSAITGVVNSTSYGSTTRSSAGINMSSSFHGNRYIIFPVESNLPPGDYWLGMRMSSSAAGTAGNMLVISQTANTHPRFYGFDVATNGTDKNIFRNIAVGFLSATSSALPSGVSFTQLSTGGTFFPVYALNTTI